jgi:hypothetical protein
MAFYTQTHVQGSVLFRVARVRSDISMSSEMSEERIIMACGHRWQLSLRSFLDQIHQIQCDHAGCQC